jgi:hypothetical protein
LAEPLAEASSATELSVRVALAEALPAAWPLRPMAWPLALPPASC